jgi:hypothetical protein
MPSIFVSFEPPGEQAIADAEGGDSGRLHTGQSLALSVDAVPVLESDDAQSHRQNILT